MIHTKFMYGNVIVFYIISFNDEILGLFITYMGVIWKNYIYNKLIIVDSIQFIQHVLSHKVVSYKFLCIYLNIDRVLIIKI